MKHAHAWTVWIGWLMAIAGGISHLARAQESGGLSAARVPRLTIPRLERVPTVDGRLEAGEWDHAAAVSGFIDVTGARGGLLNPSPAVIYAGHDGRRLYIAMWQRLRPGVKPSMKYRRRDEPVYMDNYQFEIWISPPVRDRLESYQFIGNAYGAIFDVRHVPDLGIANVQWNGRWEFKNQVVRGEYWSAELAIDFAEFGVESPSPDTPWRGLFAVAWPQRSWPYTFGWYKNVTSHAELVFSSRGEAARLLDFSSLADNRFLPRLELVADRSTDAEAVVRGGVGEVRGEARIAARGGGTHAAALELSLPEWREGVKFQTAELDVQGAGGQILLRGDWRFAPQKGGAPEASSPPDADPEWKMQVRVQFAPLALGLLLWADVLDYPRRDDLAEVRYIVRPKNADDSAAVAHAQVTDFAYDAAESYLSLPKTLPYGEYEVVVRFVDRSGRILEETTREFVHRDLKKEFVWLGEAVGADIRVAPPFEPVRVEGTSLRVWGRTHVMEGALPRAITSAGAELLARPITLAALQGGQRAEARIIRPFRLESRRNEEAVFDGAYELAGLRIELKGTLAFDGMLYYRLKAEPISGERGEAVDRLFIAIPVRPAHALYYFSTGGGWNVAFGETVSPQAGMIWSSNETADFVPYVGLTDDDRAVQWFADNDHEWVLGTDAPCAQIERLEDAVEIQINLVRKTGPVPGFGAEFGFIASPVKPVPRHWRHACLDSRPMAGSKINFFFGPGHGGTPIDLHDTKKLVSALKLEVPEGQSADEFLRDLPPVGDRWDAGHLRKVLGGKYDDADRVRRSATDPNPHRVRHCYFYNSMMYFEGNRSAAFRTFFPGEWTRIPSSGWFHLTPVESYQDFFSFHLDLWFKHWYVPGLYFDEVYFAPDYNLFNGNGRILPDGTVRPSVPLMHQRRYHFRMWQLFHHHGKEPFIWVHTSNYMAPHAISVADIAMFGEDRTPTPTSDIIDTIPPLLFRSIGRAQKFGFVPVWMGMAGRGGPQWGFAGRQFFGWCWMHDVVPEYHTTWAGRHLVALRAGWGIDEDDVRFIPYWASAPAAEVLKGGKVIVSAWTRPHGRAMLMAMNLDHTTEAVAHLRLNAAALGLPPSYRVLDLESGPAQAWLDLCREAWQLIRQNAPASAMRPLMTRANPMLLAMRYLPDELTTLAEGPEVELTIPPRDFRVIVVEP